MRFALLALTIGVLSWLPLDGAQAKPAIGLSAHKPSAEYYTNIDGQLIHRPMRSDQKPDGATARCRDGSWSFSTHRRGTCSYHGGVASWE